MGSLRCPARLGSLVPAILRVAASQVAERAREREGVYGSRLFLAEPVLLAGYSPRPGVIAC